MSSIYNPRDNIVLPSEPAFYMSGSFITITPDYRDVRYRINVEYYDPIYKFTTKDEIIVEELPPPKIIPLISTIYVNIQTFIQDDLQYITYNLSQLFSYTFYYKPIYKKSNNSISWISIENNYLKIPRIVEIDTDLTVDIIVIDQTTQNVISENHIRFIITDIPTIIINDLSTQLYKYPLPNIPITEKYRVVSDMINDNPATINTDDNTLNILPQYRNKNYNLHISVINIETQIFVKNFYISVTELPSFTISESISSTDPTINPISIIFKQSDTFIQTNNYIEFFTPTNGKIVFEINSNSDFVRDKNYPNNLSTSKPYILDNNTGQITFYNDFRSTTYNIILDVYADDYPINRYQIFHQITEPEIYPISLINTSIDISNLTDSQVSFDIQDNFKKYIYYTQLQYNYSNDSNISDFFTLNDNILTILPNYRGINYDIQIQGIDPKFNIESEIYTINITESIPPTIDRLPVSSNATNTEMVVFMDSVDYIEYLTDPSIVYRDLRLDILETLGLNSNFIDNVIIERVQDGDNQIYPILLKSGIITEFLNVKKKFEINLLDYYNYIFPNNLIFDISIDNTNPYINVKKDDNILTIESAQLSIEYTISITTKDQYTNELNDQLRIFIQESGAQIVLNESLPTTFNLVDKNLLLNIMEYFDDYIFKQYLTFTFTVDTDNSDVKKSGTNMLLIKPDYRGNNYKIYITATDIINNITNTDLEIDIKEDGAKPILLNNTLQTEFNDLRQESKNINISSYFYNIIDINNIMIELVYDDIYNSISCNMNTESQDVFLTVDPDNRGITHQISVLIKDTKYKVENNNFTLLFHENKEYISLNPDTQTIFNNLSNVPFEIPLIPYYTYYHISNLEYSYTTIESENPSSIETSNNHLKIYPNNTGFTYNVIIEAKDPIFPTTNNELVFTFSENKEFITINNNLDKIFDQLGSNTININLDNYYNYYHKTNLEYEHTIINLSENNTKTIIERDSNMLYISPFYTGDVYNIQITAKDPIYPTENQNLIFNITEDLSYINLKDSQTIPETTFHTLSNELSGSILMNILISIQWKL